MRADPLDIVFLSSEVVPFSKTGGLADVAGALPAALRRAGHSVTTITPLYATVERTGIEARADLGDRTVTAGPFSFDYTVHEHGGSQTLFLDIPALFERPTIYTDGPDEHIRFAAWAKAALEVIAELGERPDIIHVNDWQTGSVPALLKGPMADNPVLGGVSTVLTIHNLGYQGVFGPDAIAVMGLTGFEYLLHQEHLDLGWVSLLETAILHADAITTVSPTYAKEIQTPDGGAGLDDLLRRRAADVHGILNGIDDDVWNPRLDRYIPHRYSAKSLWRKEWCKRDLLASLGLPYHKGVPVVGLISRLTHQKGIDLLKGPLAHFLQSWDMRLVVLGSGEADYEEFFAWLARIQPDKVSFTSGYDEGLSHRIEAGSDIFLMPSLYEPCGLNQMYSLAYGTAPVVRKVGGLADTVEHFNPTAGTGTGFVFEHFSEDGLGWALGQALATHTDQKTWQILQRNGMEIDNSWTERAAEYEALYRKL